MDDYFRDLICELSRREKVLEEKQGPPANRSDANLQQKEIIHSRQKEAKYVYNLMKVLKLTRWCNRESLRYIISSKWFSKWKAYVGYEDFILKKGKSSNGSVHSNATGNNLAKYAFLNSPHPGAISNQSLILDSSNCYHDFSNPVSVCNSAIRETAEETKDYYILTNDLWSFISAKYDTDIDISRKIIPNGINGSLKLDISLSRVSILIKL